VSGYVAACYLFPPTRSLNWIYWTASIAVSAGIALIEIASGSAELGLAFISLAAWVATVAITPLASASTARSFRDTDAQAAALLGDCAQVGVALTLIQQARRTIPLSELRFRRLIVRCIQPLPPSGREEERARVVCNAPIPPLRVPKRRVRPAPAPAEPRYEP
jgi:hypothetical protein